MQTAAPHAVVIPFGVPSEGRGLGVGLAALVHTCAHFDGGGVAIAQLQARAPNGRSNDACPVEAFLSPAAWRDIAARGDASTSVAMVITGAFEPPTDGQGAISLLAFDPRDGHTRAKTDAAIDGEHAGATIVEALERLWTELGGGVGALQGVRDLGWEAFESVLRAERCALHDPTRGGPHDRLAAMLHLGRAIDEAPSSQYPRDRLASFALETAAGKDIDPRTASAAVRALERAVTDADGQVELVEALGALLLILGQPVDAERRLNAAIAIAPRRPRPYTLLAQSLRAQGNLDGALAALQAGTGLAASDPLMTIELGHVHLARGETVAAETAWRDVLARDPVNPVAFARMAELATRRRDVTTAEWLVDTALSVRDAHPDVFRAAVQLALEAEGKSLARASRVVRLCDRLLERLPDDPSGLLSSAQALLAMDQPLQARARLERLARMASHSAQAAEAQLVRLGIDEPRAELEIRSVLRAAHSAGRESLPEIAARGRHLATLYVTWAGWFAAAIAERRLGRWQAARHALELALEIAPGAVLVRLELGRALLALNEVTPALAQAEALVRVAGALPAAWTLLARALSAADRGPEAIHVVRRALAMHPESDEAAQLLTELLQPRGPAWLGTVRRFARRFART